jgi:hypothetical protein
VIFIHVYTFEMFIHLKKALSSSFPALYKYNEYTVYKIISILDWMPIMHNINLYVAQILKDLQHCIAPSRHRHAIVDPSAWQRMCSCAAKEKIGCSGVKILYITWEVNVLKFTKNCNNDNDSSKFLWTWQKALKNIQRRQM